MGTYELRTHMMEGENHSFKSSSYKHSIVYAPCPTNNKFFKETMSTLKKRKKKDLYKLSMVTQAYNLSPQVAEAGGL